MSLYTRLPSELRRKIILHALYRTYTTDGSASAHRNYDGMYSILVETDLRLGHRTLSALKLTNRTTYHEAVAASEVWLSYLTIDLLEELELLRERLWTCGEQELYKENGSIHWTAEFFGEYFEDNYRYTQMSMGELPQVFSYQHRLKVIEHERRMGETTEEGGSAEIGGRAEGGESTEVVQGREVKRQGSLERRLVVCFGPTDEATVAALARGLTTGIRAIYGDSKFEKVPFWWKNDCNYELATEKQGWESLGALSPDWEAGDRMDWRRPYPHGKLVTMQTLERGQLPDRRQRRPPHFHLSLLTSRLRMRQLLESIELETPRED